MTPTNKAGRSDLGRLRNFQAMGGDKFRRTYHAVIAQNDDPSAIAAVTTEAINRGWPMGPSGPVQDLTVSTQQSFSELLDELLGGG